MLSGLRGFEEEPLDGRKVPLNLYYPNSVVDRYVIRWDATLGVSEIIPPEAHSMAASFGNHTLHTEVSDSIVTLEITKKYFSYQVDASSFDDFEAFREQMKDINDRFVKLVLAE